MVMALSLVLAACSGSESVSPEPVPAPKADPAPDAGGEMAKPAPIPQVWSLPEGHHAGLLDSSAVTGKAPDTYKVKFTTTKGEFTVQVNREWAPIGADRFHNLVEIGFYDKASFFRTIDGFVTQFGISAYPAVTAAWLNAKLADDPVRQSNTRGRVTFATAGPNSRTTQVFINYSDTNANLDGMGFAPFGEVIEGMEVVDSLHKTGNGAPRGPGPSQGILQSRGGAYIEAQFPSVDTVVSARIIE